MSKRPRSEATRRRKASVRGRRRSKAKSKSIGAPPGTLVSLDEGSQPVIDVIAYGPDTLDTFEADLGALAKYVERREGVLWVDVTGLGDAQVVHTIGKLFELHPLALEDVLNGGQRPKVEVYDEHLFIVTRIVTPGEPFETEQINLFVGADFVVSFQEQPGDCFEAVRERIRKQRGRVRSCGADYLAYALLDAIVDHFGPVVDRYGDQLEELEGVVLEGDAPDAVPALLSARRDLRVLRRLVRATLAKLEMLLREDLPVITPDTRTYLRDCHDHALRLVDSVESWRELAANLMDVHLALSSQQLNSVMKVLTMIATIFIPLSFIAGVYGMNFDDERSPFNMPELDWYFGYPFALGLMLLVVVGQLVYFRRKGWLGADTER